MEKKTFEIVIYNQKFSIRSDADEKHVKKVADWVNKKMNDLAQANSTMSSLQVAILSCLNMADEFFKVKEWHNDKVGEWTGQVDDIINRLESPKPL